MKQYTLHLVPLGGLCNRMRAIDSALALGEAQDRKVRIYWMQRENLNCPYDLLFKPFKNSGVEVFERRKPPRRFLYVKPLVHQVLKPAGCLETRFTSQEFERLVRADFKTLTNRNLDIMTFVTFYPSAHPFRCFEPITEIKDRIDERTSGFDANVIGVHIRRTDHVKAIANSPDEAFFRVMDAEIEHNEKARFYLATDSIQVKKTFGQRYGDRLIMTPHETSRSSIGGIQEAVVELYSLSRTQKILGSYVSSFSATASEIGRIPVISVTRD